MTSAMAEYLSLRCRTRGHTRLLEMQDPTDLQLFQATELSRPRATACAAFFEIYDEFDEVTEARTLLSLNSRCAWRTLAESGSASCTLQLFATLFRDSLICSLDCQSTTCRRQAYREAYSSAAVSADFWCQGRRITSQAVSHGVGDGNPEDAEKYALEGYAR